ncbi:Rieske 2Fe-2S domain-containing protein [Alcanivorax sp. IO_7]|nr:Rieske 2Fe-2S domain-containing protein [Alcanivorax sp. IO_7]
MFHRLIRTLDLHDGLRLPVRIGRHELLLLHESGETWLVQRRCPRRLSLERASLRDGVLRCPGHGLEFSLHSGRCRAQPDYCLKRYMLEFDGPWLGSTWTRPGATEGGFSGWPRSRCRPSRADSAAAAP